jgi:hypothetical protein
VLCLFRTVMELKKVRNLKVIVALRTNIFRKLDFAGGIAGQAEKFWALTLPIRWTPNELSGLLDMRVKAAAIRHGRTDLQCLEDILPRPHKHKGDAFDHILRRTMMRPRDVMAYLKECHDLSSGHPIISWDHIDQAEQLYSFNRLRALVDEWGPSYPGIEHVFDAFRGTKRIMSKDDLWDHLNTSSLLLADGSFTGRDWLIDMLKQVWDPKGGPTIKGNLTPFYELLQLLHESGFLGIRHGSPKGIFAQDHPDYLSNTECLSNAQGFLVHPAFWITLGIPGVEK